MEIDYDVKDLAMVVLPHLDYESQLRAIHNLLSIHEKAEQVISKNIAEVTDFLKKYQKSSDEYFYYLEAERGERIHTSIYQAAAHSMAAVGMLGPFIESLFDHAFCCILEIFYYEQKLVPKHSRFEKGDWQELDCHYLWKKKEQEWMINLSGGVLQISKAIGLEKFLPNDLNTMLTALFSYRNKMFHCGFEWPIDERKQFSKRIEEGKLPAQWFKFATSGGEHWIFYLSSDFIVHCLNMADSIIEGIGMYVKNKIETIQG